MQFREHVKHSGFDSANASVFSQITFGISSFLFYFYLLIIASITVHK